MSRYDGAKPVGWGGIIASLGVIAAAGALLLAGPAKSQDMAAWGVKCYGLVVKL